MRLGCEGGTEVIAEQQTDRCVRCRLSEAVTLRRTVTSVGTLSRWTEPVCAACARELDDEREHEARCSIAVDRLFERRCGRVPLDLAGLMRVAA